MKHHLATSILLPAALLGFGMTAAFGPAAHQDTAAQQDVTQSDDVQAFPDRYFFYEAERPAQLRAMEGENAPELQLKDWIGKPRTLKQMRGKVVIVDFWGTWCGPCMRALPKNVKLQEKYKDDVVFLGVHDARRGYEKMGDLAKEMGLNYPLAVDDAGVSTKNWNVRFWPTYVAIDRRGIVRAAGLKPDHVEDVIKVLAKEDAPQSTQVTAEDVPEAWLEGSSEKRARFAKLMAADTAPAIESDEWINTEPLTSEDLEGKIVVLDFWATWCGPCIRSIPHTNELQNQYRDQGVVIIGVCHERGVEKMAATAKEHGIQYPICADRTGALVNAYQVDSYPDYYIIDRSGKVLIPDCANNSVEDAIKLLLGESKG